MTEEEKQAYLDPDRFIDEMLAFVKRVATRNDIAWQSVTDTLKKEMDPEVRVRLRTRQEEISSRCHEVNTILSVVQDRIFIRRRLLQERLSP